MNNDFIFKFLLPFGIIYLVNYLYYLFISKELGKKAIYLQMRRYIPCAILVVLPSYLANENLFSLPYLAILIPGMFWAFTFPTLYSLTHKKTAMTYGWHLDFVFGMYLVALLSSLKLLLTFIGLPIFLVSAIITILGFSFSLIPIFEIGYFLVYKECINDVGMLALLQTNLNEAFSYLKELKLLITLSIITLIITLLLFFRTGLIPIDISTLYNLKVGILAILFIYLTFYLFRKPPKGVFPRTAIVELYLDTKEYFKHTAEYKINHQKLLENLDIFDIPPIQDTPQTIIMVIGESASRDYINAISGYKRETSPWLTKHKNDENFIIFPNAYSCWYQTVPVVERATTEANQYNNKPFNNSYSILDIAKAAGYTTSWFSNQGHVGSADTAITIIAETADRSKWTNQKLGQIQYDTALLSFLKEVDPTKNNFVVLHLEGSHDNYLSRYPAKATIWGTPGKYNLLDNYDNSLAFTDKLLQRIQEYATENLNLQFMFYFSDHATIPDKRRAPSFQGFGSTRIPFFIYLSDNYMKKHPKITKNLKTNKNKYFTNDLIYDFFCGLLDVKANKHYDPKESLASNNYKYDATTLKTKLGTLSLSEDKFDAKRNPIK
jgi:heptose-I-phosphate ethanolaminephosphotransferase